MSALIAIGKWCIEYWYVVVLAALITGLAAYGQSMRGERDGIKAEYAEYRRAVAVAAQAAAEQALKKTIEDERKKEQADAENENLKRDLAARTNELRAERSLLSLVPASRPGSSCPDGQACFDRPLLERALRDFDQEIQGLVDQGSAVTIDLDTAKRWAKDR